MNTDEPNQFDIGKDKVKTSVMIPAPMFKVLEMLAKRYNSSPSKEAIRLLEKTMRELAKHDTDIKKIRDQFKL